MAHYSKSAVCFALIFSVPFASAFSMELTNVHGLHIEVSGKEFLVTMDSETAGKFSGFICAQQTPGGSVEEVAATIGRAEKEDRGLDITISVENGLMCLQGIRQTANGGI
jgi:hypothetical protein